MNIAKKSEDIFSIKIDFEQQFSLIPFVFFVPSCSL